MVALLRASIMFLLVVNQALNMAVAADAQPGITLLSGTETIYLGDSVIIEVEAVGIVDPLDISPLFQGADLIRETTGTRIAVINERVVEVKLRRMEFVPKREGRVFFGPLGGMSIKGPISSNTVIIDVQPPADTNWEPESDDLQIQLTLTVDDGTTSAEPFDVSSGLESAPEPFRGQHIIADIILRHKHPIADEQLTLPDFKGFDVLEQFVERRTILEQDTDENWRVTAWRYHLFAQRSGNIPIEAVHWKGTVIKSRTQRFDFSKSSDSTVLHIKPASSDHEWWLPSSRVSLSDEWSKDPRELSAGDEIIRTITLSADNVLASHLPDVVPLESRALTTSPLSQTRSQELVGDQITATAVFEFRMVAQSPIPVFLDTVRVPWYNTAEAIDKEAIIPARRINVGLPDRADLLADIALDNSWLNNILLRLQANSQQFVPWHITLVSLILLALWLLFREIQHGFAQRRLRKRRLCSTVLPEL